MSSSIIPRSILVIGCGALLTGCLVGPDYAQPIANVPPSFKGNPVKGDKSREAVVRPDWWTIFEDAELTELEESLAEENLDLKGAVARAEQAWATLGVTRADLFPNVSGDGSITRIRQSENDQGGGFFGNSVYTQYSSNLVADWEIDLWGRVRRLINSARYDAEGLEALVADTKLSLQSQLASAYFTLRFLDQEIGVLEAAVETREANSDLATERFEGGAVSELDVARADAELASTQADLARLAGARNTLENAIAVLAGKSPSEFSIPRRSWTGTLPSIPSGLPMELLSNRPDVAFAERALASSSEQVGVAVAEFFPRVSLTGAGGLSSIDSSDFFNWSSRTFQIGPQVTVPVFQAGRLKSNLVRAEAIQKEDLAFFQQTVLIAFREVEDALGDLKALRNEANAQEGAVQASSRALELSDLRYRKGLVSSLEVIDAQRERLTAKRRAVQIRSERFGATVRLIEALGGGLSPDTKTLK